MLQARIDAYREILSRKSRDEILESAVYFYAENGRLSEELDFLKSTQQEMMLQFQQMRDELSGTRAELKTLRDLNRHLTGVRDIQSKNLFGRSTEKADALMNDALSSSVHADPLSEDADCNDQLDDKPSENGKPSNPFSAKHLGKKGGKKQPGKRNRDLEKLPKQSFYDYDINELNKIYGIGNWRFVYWKEHRCVEVVRQFTYLKVTYTPVVSSGLEHSLITVPYDKALLQKSLLSPSLFATIATDKYGLYLPINRQASDPERFGISFSRQTISNWIVKISLELLLPVYQFLKDLLFPYEYQQCDETTYLVIINGTDRSPGSKGYIWVHRSSPFSEGPQIILYSYDNSRSADHLREFYEELTSHIFLSCDAYSAYPAFEKENSDLVTLCGCLMHARRRFADALRILKIKDLSKEQILSLPEAQAIEIIQNIYREESLLTDLSAEGRLALRQEKVKPHVDAFFRFIHALDITNPSYSDKLKDAVLYSIHQEEALRRFLSDGHIPIDNGATERSVKPIALGRRNYLFSNSLSGAEATTVLSSLIETAKANNAEPYYYIKYLTEIMPKYVRQRVPIKNKEDLFPWSNAFRDYQLSEKENHLASLKAPPGNEKPRTPRKRDSIPLSDSA